MSCHDEPIDLTADDDDEEIHLLAPQRSLLLKQQPQQSRASFSFMDSPPKSPSIFTSQHQYHPPFAGPSSSSAFFPDRHQAPRLPPLPSLPSQSSRSSDSVSKVIDLTGSTPSPPPPPLSHVSPSFLIPYEELSPRTPVCIGQLHSQALILYPCEYVHTTDLSCEEWVPVKFEYEYDPSKPRPETLHIKSFPVRSPTGQTIEGERFGFADQKTAITVGGMLSRGLVRLEAKVRKGLSSHPVLPLLMLVYTPKGNVPAVGSHLSINQLMLDHPTHAVDLYNLKGKYYHNPHNPPPGGYNHVPPFYRPPQRWNAPVVASHSVEVQRSQLDNVFETMKGNEDLAETKPAPEICTPLYPHQKKALTFLLEREHEKVDGDVTFPSLWDKHVNPLSQHTTWVHKITQKEVYEEPKDAKGAILADDMGLGKTISCIALIAATMNSARTFANSPLDMLTPPHGIHGAPDSSHFEGTVWGMPSTMVGPMNAKEKARSQKLQEKYESALSRVSRIKAKSRATLIVCPLSTISNWEDQLREHWKGEVHVIGGGASGSQTSSSATASSSATPRAGTPLANVASLSVSSLNGDTKSSVKSCRVREGPPLRVYVYHGNARRPDPSFLADFDVVVTTYATLASEYSKQNKSIVNHEAEEDGNNSAGVDSDGIEVDELGNPVGKLPKAKKRKKPCGPCPNEATSPLQSVHWFRVVLDEAHAIKETNTVGCRACCDLMADRRLCLTGTPVQNKLDDVFALIKFLRLSPLDDKVIWTEFVGTPVKFAHRDGSLRLRIVMQHITLRRTKESENQSGQKILNLPPRRDELRYLDFDEQEQKIYSHFYNQSKAEFDELSKQNQVMKNYVGILQRILRLRQICDHFELVEGKELDGQVLGSSYEDLTSTIEKDGLNEARAHAIFWILREAATTQCVECGAELCATVEPAQTDGTDLDTCSAPGTKRPRKSRNSSSRAPTRANSPTSGTPGTGGGHRAVLTRCQHLYCLSCYRSCVCMGWPNVPSDTVRPCSACQAPLHQSDALEIKSDILSGDVGTVGPGATPKKKPRKREKKPRLPDGSHLLTSTKIKSLLVDLMQFSRTNPHSCNYDSSCVEIQMIDEKGNELNDNIVKTVVFSQWTTMLDKVEDALEVAGIRYDRLDGTMKRDDRTRAMEALKYDPGCEVLLVSLKAGGVGLNLTAAQRVYLMDPYWNPAVENQAIDRIHRLGQNKPVTTVKLIIKDSIEHRLLDVQKKKMELANLTLGEKGFTKADLLKHRKAELDHMFT
ncbi:hypothetical protein E1B28_000896 [Marasmius oreades]|uniref:Uncharacterized protein n=1 Tax=Marasmius oreades TaxID=181124 RepID=A0A9P8AEU5_9AGAR|nr:uncharacterized protein E1B28_000896 [Marasmius oreades]KAG7099012.1 hypothetical protein E1B28_000896 [Marasmius oreades]